MSKQETIWGKQSTSKPYDWYKNDEAGHKAEFELWYDQCKPYLDRNYVSELSSKSEEFKFQARWWEAYLCQKLLSKGHNLLLAKEGQSDFVFERDGKKIQIDATQARDGETDPIPKLDAVGLGLGCGQIFEGETPYQDIMLRIL